MSNLTHGMDIGAVRQLGQFLQSEATSQIRDLMGRIDSQLSSAGWQGNDAEQFRSEWQNHKNTLNQIINSLEQFGQKAQQNAQAQEQTSAS
jgi:uncharacterized protein YukE